MPFCPQFALQCFLDKLRQVDFDPYDPRLYEEESQPAAAA